VHDNLDLFVAEDPAHGNLVAQVAVVERYASLEGAAMTKDEIIQNDGPMTSRHELAHAMTTNVSGTTNNEDVHSRGLYCHPDLVG
jgi:hypothetical protein